MEQVEFGCELLFQISHDVTLLFAESPYFKVVASTLPKFRLCAGLSAAFKVFFQPDSNKAGISRKL